MEKIVIYITVGNIEEAKKIGRKLLEERLVACVNMIDGMQSMYWWHDAIQEDMEVILIAKTTNALAAKVINQVTALHSYEIPCIVSLPIKDGNPAFLEWIEKEVTE
ncbi:MAG: divalent-cation tolerance protein CutA [Desulfobacterales bacterium]|nr:divalent-cation tolerance protein CutA [Desulfobacterales bacterium]